MSVRKVSELPYIDVASNMKKPEERNKILASKMELSYCDDATTQYKFTSKHISYSDMISSFIHEVTGDEGDEDGDNTIIHFWHPTYFHKIVRMYDGLELTGDFYVNKDIDNDTLKQYTMSLRSGNIYIHGVEKMELSSQTITSYSNNFTMKDYMGSVMIAQFLNSGISLNQNTDVNGNLNTTRNFDVGGDSRFSGNLSCYGDTYFEKVINGTAMKALWADLAESYQTDRIYEPGTLVTFGGEKEITIARDTVNAVITTKPGFILGGSHGDGEYQEIALVGRVPVLVKGRIDKFDDIELSEIPGVGCRKSSDSTSQTIAKALKCKNDDGIGLVECVVQLKL